MNKPKRFRLNLKSLLEISSTKSGFIDSSRWCFAVLVGVGSVGGSGVGSVGGSGTLLPPSAPELDVADLERMQRRMTQPHGAPLPDFVVRFRLEAAAALLLEQLRFILLLGCCHSTHRRLLSSKSIQLK